MNTIEKQNPASNEAEKFLDGELFANMVRGGAAQLRSNATEVNNLNVFPVPDGDTGDNMSMTIEGGVAALEGMHSTDLPQLPRSCPKVCFSARAATPALFSPSSLPA